VLKTVLEQTAMIKAMQIPSIHSLYFRHI